MIAGGSDTQLQNHEIFEYKTYMLSVRLFELFEAQKAHKLKS